MNIEVPGPLRSLIIGGFASIYNINQDEAERPLVSYKSIGDFFIRRLKPGVRPISDCDIVHPADAYINQAGPLNGDKLIQAKGKHYSALEFLGSEDYFKSLVEPSFMTYYLCPTDYHRVHSPVSGKILSMTYIPGALWPVNEWSVNSIDNLFSVNERVVIEIDARGRKLFAVLVGATNVGKMTLAFDPEIISNQGPLGKPVYKSYENLNIEKGDELGCFHMGSTVILVMDSSFAVDCFSHMGKSTKMGGALI